VIPVDDFGLVRIDDRLIHGQVIAGWIKHQRFTRIVILDDDVAADSFLQQVLRLAAPPDLRVEVYSIAEGIRLLGQDDANRKSTMILLKTPLAARRLLDEGLAYDALNIGGIGHKPGRKSIFKNISASQEELAVLKYLVGRGVKITLLTVPGEQSQDFAVLASRL
jgi:mannose/fructose/N-acetylgalactosamine-specific phosphotransferase system component IIB